MNATSKNKSVQIARCYVDWYPVSIRPPSNGESRLVMLAEDNAAQYTSRHPVMAEYGWKKDHPNDWTIFSSIDGENIIITEDIVA